MPRITVESPLGPLTLTETAGALTALDWTGRPEGGETALLGTARSQLAAYFAGRCKNFDLPLRVSGTPFLQAVCAALRVIPFGQTRTYGEIAAALGASAQAVGTACGANPLPILIPCHRVLGATHLGGYSGAGGVETKVALLRLEGAAGLLI